DVRRHPGDAAVEWRPDPAIGPVAVVVDSPRPLERAGRDDRCAGVASSWAAARWASMAARMPAARPALPTPTRNWRRSIDLRRTRRSTVGLVRPEGPTARQRIDRQRGGDFVIDLPGIEPPAGRRPA